MYIIKDKIKWIMENSISQKKSCNVALPSFWIYSTMTNSFISIDLFGVFSSFIDLHVCFLPNPFCVFAAEDVMEVDVEPKFIVFFFGTSLMSILVLLLVV